MIGALLRSVFAMLPPRVVWLLAGLAGAGVVYIGHLIDVHNHERRAFAAGQHEVQARWDAQRAVDAETSLLAEAKQRKREAEWTKARQETDDEAQRLAARRRAADSSFAAVDSGLRPAVAAAIAAEGRRASEDPAAGGGGAPADAPTGMCADLLDQADKRLRILASYADAAHDAGLTCERQFDSLIIDQ